MADFKVRKAYYRLMIDTEYDLHQESDFYYAYLDAKKYGHYYTITLMPWQIDGFYHRLMEYIDVHRAKGQPQLVRTAYKLLNEIVELIGDPMEPTHVPEGNPSTSSEQS